MQITLTKTPLTANYQYISKNTQTKTENSNSQPFRVMSLTNVPYNYFGNISFGANIDVIQKMQKYADDPQKHMNELKELFEELHPDTRKSVKEVAANFKEQGMTFEEYLGACVKKPWLFDESSEKITKNITDTVKKLENIGVKRKDLLTKYVEGWVKTPPPFFMHPTSVAEYAATVADRFKIGINEYVDACLEQYPLFNRNADTTIEHVIKSASILKIDEKDYIKACLNKPQLFYYKPETIEANVNGVIERFGLDKKEYVKAFLKRPQLFYQKPETIKANVNGVIDRFGLDERKYVKACLKAPQLFYQKPETIEANVTGVIKRFGLDERKYVKACLKQPSLFCQAPEAIEANVNGVIKIFGLDRAEYVEACLKQPPLFCLKPKTTEANVNGVIQEFGLNEQKYVEACLRQPSLFCQKPETIAEHIRAYMYCDYNKHGINKKGISDIVRTKLLTYSTSLIYLKHIIRPQLRDKYGLNLTESGLKPKLKDYFDKNPNTQFKIQILEDTENNLHENFIEVIKDYAKNQLKHENAFTFEVVKSLDKK